MPVSMNSVIEVAEEATRTKRIWCRECGREAKEAGRYFGVDEEVPYVILDPSTAVGISTSIVTLNGRCSSDKHVVEHQIFGEEMA